MKRSVVAFLLSISALMGAAAGVPEPQPVKSAVEVSAVYYPGTDLPTGKSAGYFNFSSVAQRMKELSLL